MDKLCATEKAFFLATDYHGGPKYLLYSCLTQGSERGEGDQSRVEEQDGAGSAENVCGLERRAAGGAGGGRRQPPAGQEHP
jgi:hypothetical protein